MKYILLVLVLICLLLAGDVGGGIMGEVSYGGAQWSGTPSGGYGGNPGGNTISLNNPSPYGGWLGGQGSVPGEEEEEFAIPRWFGQPPPGLPQLSPLAQLYLGRLFQPTMESQQTQTYMPAGTPAVMSPGTEENPMGEVITPAVEPTAQTTAAQQFKMPSAQLYMRMRAAGAIPSLQAYSEQVLQVPWESVMGEMQGLWPKQQKTAPAEYRVQRQR